MNKLTHTISEKDTIELMTRDGVFVPTGTSTALIESVKQAKVERGRLLDLGCGMGVVGITLARLGIAEGVVYASDICENAVGLTRANFRASGIEGVVRAGSLFEPWEEEKFDIIVLDVSGVARDFAAVSPWFQGVPCESGECGTLLTVESLMQATAHLTPAGKIFFPVLSLSRVDKILNTAAGCYQSVELVKRYTWPLPKDFSNHSNVLQRLVDEGNISVEEKFGLFLWTTDVYVAHN